MMMSIGVVPDPYNQPDWAKIESYLKPAAERGGVPILEEHELVWSIYHDGELLGACTTRLIPSTKTVEIVLVGGRQSHLWVEGLSDLLSVWARCEGAERIRAYGRKGWVKILVPLGWKVIGTENGVTAYERAL